MAQSRRVTCATDANAVSSRSHAVCILRLESGGQLMLVDCAGSERKKDSMYHSKEWLRLNMLNMLSLKLILTVRIESRLRGDNSRAPRSMRRCMP